MKDVRNVGRSLLPLRLIDDAELIQFKSSEEITDYLRNTNITGLMLLSPSDMKLKTASEQKGTPIVDPFYWLRQTISDIWNYAETHPNITTFTLQYKEDHRISGIPGKLDLIIRGYFLHKGMPFLKVTFVDTEKALLLLTDNKLSLSVLTKKRTEALDFNPLTLWFDMTKWVTMVFTVKEHMLIKKLLLTNSRRIQQSHPCSDQDGWYCETFMQMLFHRDANILHDEKIQSDLEFADMLKISPDLADAGNSFHVPLDQVICAECGKTGKNLKKCGRCMSVSYCDKNCQKLNWTTHKHICKSSSDGHACQADPTDV